MKRSSIVCSYQLLTFLVLFTGLGFAQSFTMPTAGIEDSNPPSLTAAVVAHPASVELPDAPSVGWRSNEVGSLIPSGGQQIIEPAPALRTKADRVATLPYWATTAAVFGSNVAAIELLQSCLAGKRCQSVPGAMQSRGAMYGVGLPVAAGVSYLGYFLKKKHKRWWYVPAAMATSFDLYFAINAGEDAAER